MTDNILQAYRRATPDQVARGVDWYSDAHAFARALDPGNVRRAAGVIAALSPNTKWNRNVVLAARTYSEGFSSGTLTDNMRKADAIYNGADPADVLGGPKTRAFAEMIADPTNAHHVVVDRHAVSIALGRVASDGDIHATIGTPKRYEAMANEYRAAASILGVSPSIVQAVTWLVWRESMLRTSAANRREASQGNVPM